jgi:pimeloyl-ACP methyl ester carboxylesterase
MNLKVLAEVWKEITRANLKHEIKKIQKETLIIVGGHDVQVFPKKVKEQKEYIQDSKFQLIPNGTHAMFWDFPKKMALITKDFLSN